MSFHRAARDDLQRLWDSVNELFESANVTSRNIEDIYDKDILRLHDFARTARADLDRLRFPLSKLSPSDQPAVG